MNQKIILNNLALNAPTMGVSANMFELMNAPMPSGDLAQVIYLGLNAGMASRICANRDGAGILRPNDSPTSDAIVRILNGKDAGKLAFIQWCPWAQYVSASDYELLPAGASALAFASVLGHTGFSAYCAIRLLDLSAKDHVIIASAAGGVGSAAVQFALASGAKVSGIGSKERLEFITSLGAQAIERCDDLRLPSANAFCDSAGGVLLERAIDALQIGSKVAVYGYLNAAPPRNFDRIIHKNISLIGFSVMNLLHWRKDFYDYAIKLHQDGKLVPICQVYEGLERAGEGFCDIFNSPSPGRKIIKLSDE